MTGNIFLDRENRSKAHSTSARLELARRINKDNLSIWMFPEGTRSRGRGLLAIQNRRIPCSDCGWRTNRTLLYAQQLTIKLI